MNITPVFDKLRPLGLGRISLFVAPDNKRLWMLGGGDGGKWFCTADIGLNEEGYEHGRIFDLSPAPGTYRIDGIDLIYNDNISAPFSQTQAYPQFSFAGGEILPSFAGIYTSWAKSPAFKASGPWATVWRGDELALARQSDDYDADAGYLMLGSLSEGTLVFDLSNNQPPAPRVDLYVPLVTNVVKHLSPTSYGVLTQVQAHLASEKAPQAILAEVVARLPKKREECDSRSAPLLTDIPYPAFGFCAGEVRALIGFMPRIEPGAATEKRGKRRGDLGSNACENSYFELR